MYPLRKRSIAALGLAALLTVAVGGAIASSEDTDYGSPALVQAGYGPGGPPATTGVRSPQASRADAGHDYGSAAVIQLGHGPGGPHAPSQS